MALWVAFSFPLLACGHLIPQEVHSSAHGVAVLTTSGSVRGWQKGDTTDVASDLEYGVISITNNEYGFGALKSDGSAVFWGTSSVSAIPGDTEKAKLTSGCSKIVGGFKSFAVLKDDGTVVWFGELFWHSSFTGVAFADVESSLTDVVDLFATQDAYAALKPDGSIVTWGVDSRGQDTTFQGDQSADLSPSDLPQVFLEGADGIPSREGCTSQNAPRSVIGS